SRESVSCVCEWSLGVPQQAGGSKKVAVPPGEQERIPLRFELPAGLPAGSYELAASFHLGTGETQKDAFTIHILPKASDPGAGREGAGAALRLSGGGVRLAAGVPARAGQPAAGRPGRRRPARLARRGDAPAAAAGVHDAAALRADGAVVRHRRDAAVALRLPR